MILKNIKIKKRTSRHRGTLPVSRLASSTPCGRAGECRRRLPISSDDLATAASPPPASLQPPSLHQVFLPPLPLTTHLSTPARVSPLLFSHLFLVDPVEEDSEVEQDQDVS